MIYLITNDLQLHKSTEVLSNNEFIDQVYQ